VKQLTPVQIAAARAQANAWLEAHPALGQTEELLQNQQFN
jgi:hypothetical protein